MGLPQEKTSFSAQEYLAWEKVQIDKHEYVAGEVFAMVGARQEHVIVAGNIFAALREHLRGTPCRPLISDMKLNVQAMEAFYYPDVMVTCDDADKVAELYVEQPKLIIEILSDGHGKYAAADDDTRHARFPHPNPLPEGEGSNESLREYIVSCTAAYDRGAKFAAYRKITSLEEYVLVDVDRKGVESFRRQADGCWLLRDFAGTDSCEFESVALTMTMAHVFEDA